MVKEVIEPWERLPGETARAFGAFAIYRDMGANRSLRKTAQKLSKNPTTFKEWSVKYNWVSRAAAWDCEQDRIAREQQSKEILEMRKTHAELGVAMLVKAAEALKLLPEDEMSASDIAKMVEVGSKLERLSRGEATDKVENKTEMTGELQITNIDLSKLSDRELIQLEEIVNKLPIT